MKLLQRSRTVLWCRDAKLFFQRFSSACSKRTFARMHTLAIEGDCMGTPTGLSDLCGALAAVPGALPLQHLSLHSCGLNTPSAVKREHRVEKKQGKRDLQMCVGARIRECGRSV